MDILELIKKRTTIRKYKNKKISNRIIKKILEAGIWSSSIHGFQPWEFIVISKRSTIRKISNSILKKSHPIEGRIDKILNLTSETIANAPTLILIYNQNLFKNVSNRIFKIKQSYINIAELTEVEAISAAIQNMILLAHSLGVGCCWNSTPLFCEKEINSFIKNNNRLVAILSLGYPNEKGRRTPRKDINEKVKFLK